MKKILKRILLVLGIAVLTLGIAAGIVFLAPIPKMNSLDKAYTFTQELVPTVAARGVRTAERLHFLNTGNSDCILIESNGQFALVDSGEDTDNVRNLPGLELEGFEQRVIDYLRKVAGDAQGNVTLEWVLGTHTHSDHIGGFDSIINAPGFTVKQAFLGAYDEQYISEYEIREWDNKEVYEQMLAACAAKDVPVISEIPSHPWEFGDFTVQFFNTKRITSGRVGENENAVGTKLTVGSQKAFLAADINNLQGAEKAIAPEIGKVDLLKVGHHGHPFSTTFAFVKALNPEISIVTNGSAKNVNPLAKFNLCLLADSPIYSTGDYNGIIATFGEEKLELTDGLHD